MESISQLISDYLEGELDAAGAARLEELLQSDPAAVDQLVLDSFVHSQLEDWMHVRQPRDELLRDALRDSNFDGCSFGAESELKEHLGDADLSRRRRLTVLAGLAAALLIAASIVAAVYFASRPAIVAQLTQASNCRWEANSSALAAGSLLHAGQPLELESGRALLTFAGGARLILEGPAAAKLVSDSKIDLCSGRVGALVPTHAVGFTVATPVAEFVDLGTEFALSLEPSDSCVLYVFDGMVEMRLPPDAAHDAEQLRISEGSAVRFDATTFDVESIPYDEEQSLLP